jgi:eukaryotic-like serine/threonine-protein kinase
MVAIGVVVAALVGAGIAWAVSDKLFTPSTAVPVLVGRTVPVATATADSSHLVVQVAGRTSSITVPLGVIISQRPAARPGASLKQGSTVSVVVSTGLPLVTLPNVTSFTDCHDAIVALASVHLVGVCPPAAAQYSSSVASGAVTGTTPTGHAPYGSTVTIVTSKGHAPLPVPTVSGAGSTYASAAATLSAAGFVPVEAKTYSASVPVNQVIGTAPAAAGPVPYGSSVTVQVSLGPQPVIVPSLVGRSPHEAAARLAAVGLQLGGPYGPPGSTTVVSTSPAGGASAVVGSTVEVYTG